MMNRIATTTTAGMASLVLAVCLAPAAGATPAHAASVTGPRRAFNVQAKKSPEVLEVKLTRSVRMNAKQMAMVNKWLRDWGKKKDYPYYLTIAPDSGNGTRGLQFDIYDYMTKRGYTTVFMREASPTTRVPDLTVELTFEH